MSKKIGSLVKDEEGVGVIGAVSGGMLGVLTEVGIFLFDVSGIGLGNLLGIYPWTALHIYPLIGLTVGGAAIGGAIGTLADVVSVLKFATISCGTTLVSYLTGMLFTK